MKIGSLEVSDICLGGCDFGGRLVGEDAKAMASRYVELGGNFFDTAHCYMFWEGKEGESERTIGRLVRELGLDVVIATKGGHVGMNGYSRPDSFAESSLVEKDLVESLDRLGMPSVDLYYLHRDDPRVPVSELIDTLDSFVKRGFTKEVGLSNWSSARVREALYYARANDRHLPAVVQNQQSLGIPSWRNSETPGSTRWISAQEAAEFGSMGLSMAPYSATANGYFAKGTGGAFETSWNADLKVLVDRIALTHSCSPTQVALAWLRQQAAPTSAIIGTANVAHLEEAMGSVQTVLSPGELAELSRARLAGEA
jgi:aryl-alcohol dehydrogenase-like predicted oxidoreductase